LDAKASINRNDVYLEVVTPGTFLPLELVQGAIGLPNRAVNIILDKVKDQLSGASLLVGKPVILVINLSRSEIDVHQIRDAIEGQLKFRLWFDRRSGRAVGEDVIREVNAISDKVPEGRILSGVLVIVRTFDDIARLIGMWLPNKNPIVPLDENSVQLLRDAVLDNLVEGPAS
jgi:hypothetical protein